VNASFALRERFIDLLARHGIRVTPSRGKVLCIFHDEKTPSLSIDTERCLFYCFGCGVKGGAKKFAALVGEEWASTRRGSRTPNVRRARLQAEQQARAILQQRKDERCAALFVEFSERWREAASCDSILTLFQRRPDFATEFSDVRAQTERDYQEALSALAVIAVQLEKEST
jgi:CHC2-type zinc finger protein